MNMNFGSGNRQGSATVRGDAGATTRLLLKSCEAAKALAVSERTLWGLTDAGEIPCVRLGRSKRYSVDALQAWIARNSLSDTERSAARSRDVKRDAPVAGLAQQSGKLPTDYMTISTMN